MINKIAHITLQYNIDNSTGIISNNTAKLTALHKLGYNNFDFYILNDMFEGIKDNVKFIKLKHSNIVSQYYNKIFNKCKFIEKYIPLHQYSKIIVRYPLSDNSLLRLVNHNNVIFEFHSTVDGDLKHYFENLEYNKSIMKINGSFRKFLDNKYSEEIYNMAKGFITVTDEMSIIESKKVNNIHKFKTISNGIDTDKYKLTSFKKFDGKTLNLIMIVSNDLYWFGIDRLISSINSYIGNININLYLVGPLANRKYLLENNNHQVIYTGYLTPAELNELYPKMNIAVGTLGLARKNQFEQSTLKVREYISRGIPLINAYYDVDVYNIPELKDYYLDFPNDESLIDFDKVVNFISNLNGEPTDISQYMHQIAVEKLDWKIKMIDYVNFVNSIK